MSSLRQDSGMTLVELLVAMALALIMFGSVLTILDVFSRQNSVDQQRNEAQDTARSAIDRLSWDLRNVAAPSGGGSGVIEQVGPYDIVFQTIDSTTTYGGSNATNAKRVRYCVDASTPGNEVLWRETQTWTTVTGPSVPVSTACPGTVTAGSTTTWNTSQKLATNLTNEYNSQNRAAFVCSTAISGTNACSAETTNTGQIRSVGVDLFIDLTPTSQPTETEIRDGIDLRNMLSAPTASFTATLINNKNVVLDGTGSSDPDGQMMTYQWYTGSTCTSANAISGATTSQWTIDALSTGSHTYTLKVTNTGGLTSCATAQSVTAS